MSDAVVACTYCGGMIEPLKDAGIIPMLVTHAAFKGPVFHLAYFCCEKCLKAYVKEHANGALNSIPCIVLPEEADLDLLAGLPKMVLAPLVQPKESDIEKMLDAAAEDLYDFGDCDDEYEDSYDLSDDIDGYPAADDDYDADDDDYGDWWEEDDEEEKD